MVSIIVSIQITERIILSGFKTNLQMKIKKIQTKDSIRLVNEKGEIKVFVFL